MAEIYLFALPLFRLRGTVGIVFAWTYFGELSGARDGKVSGVSWPLKFGAVRMALISDRCESNGNDHLANNQHDFKGWGKNQHDKTCFLTSTPCWTNGSRAPESYVVIDRMNSFRTLCYLFIHITNKMQHSYISYKYSSAVYTVAQNSNPLQHGRRQRGGRGGGQLPPVPYALPPAAPPVVVRKIICALFTLPIHCRSVNFMWKSTKCVKT